MREGYSGYVALDSLYDERLYPSELCSNHNIANKLLEENCTDSEELAPEIDDWEWGTIMFCCALNAVILAFNIMAFTPIPQVLASDFNMTILQVFPEQIAFSILKLTGERQCVD
jgi:hypothetical protein